MGANIYLSGGRKKGTGQPYRQEEQQWTLTEARMVIENWCWNYNNVGPLGYLGYITPSASRKKKSPNDG